ncbi:MAG TPA: type 1 glutamine amidotransferase [Rubrivivax sp.]|nr:type 1 glutamine amidotransferase [Rubrivivax sp.]
MEPVLILQHLTGDGPAYLGTWLRREGVPFQVRNSEAGEVFPEHMGGHSALAILGGEMSANDPLPALRRAELLILDAMARDRPVIGHCLGGQLMARALGARVGPSPAPEIGWHDIGLEPVEAAHAWFGDRAVTRVFQWHEEAFELPIGATRLAGSAACLHQAFAIGPHLAMQFHVELDEEKLRRWAALDSPQFRALQRSHASVQGGAAMLAAAPRWLPRQQALAERIYARWLAPVRS